MEGWIAGKGLESNYLRESEGRYDAVMVDAFTDSSPAGHLFTKEFFEDSAIDKIHFMKNECLEWAQANYGEI